MLDQKTEASRAMIETPFEELKSWNEKGYGIFWTFNEFKNNRRLKENCTKINLWAVEIDDGAKEDQLRLIKKGLIPSRIVETKRGYHLYFHAKNATKENFKRIMKDFLIPFYKADQGVNDVSRVFRVPGYLHQKDLNDPFLVKQVFFHDHAYSEELIMSIYPDTNKAQMEKHKESIQKISRETSTGENVWSAIFQMDQMAALERLSGTQAVFGEVYEFKKTTRNRFNIFVNGEATSCFIDEYRLIGSTSGGGPVITNWLLWLHKDIKKVVSILKSEFKELPWNK